MRACLTCVVFLTISRQRRQNLWIFVLEWRFYKLKCRWFSHVFFCFWLLSGSSPTSSPKVGWATSLLTSTDLQILEENCCCNFLAPPIYIWPSHYDIWLHTCFSIILLNNILHITFFAFHWSWINLWMEAFLKMHKNHWKKSHCGWPVAGPGVCPPTDHYDGTGAIPRGGTARPDAHQPLQPQRW